MHITYMICSWDADYIDDYPVLHNAHTICQKQLC